MVGHTAALWVLSVLEHKNFSFKRLYIRESSLRIAAIKHIPLSLLSRSGRVGTECTDSRIYFSGKTVSI